MRIATRDFGLFVVLTLLSFAIACSKSQKSDGAKSEAAPSVDHVSSLATAPLNHFLHKTFTLKSYEKFDFIVPAHTIKPTLRGNFVSFSKVNGSGMTSNQNANIDLMLLTDQEFDDFSHGQSGSTTYEAEPSFNQVVDFAVPATHEQPQSYSLVFRNTPGGQKSKFVKADFTISFE
jgi:hypothetical protein